jgi:anti-sigma B factor antagonist
MRANTRRPAGLGRRRGRRLVVDIQLEHRTERGWDVVDVAGDVDLATAPELRTRLDRLLTDGARRVIVNLQGVAFMDSSGLSAIVSGMKGIRETGGQMAIACANESILKIFAITGLDRVVSIHPSVAAAVGA